MLRIYFIIYKKLILLVVTSQLRRLPLLHCRAKNHRESLQRRKEMWQLVEHH